MALLDNLALDIAQIANHPVIVKRGALQQIDHPGIGPIALPKSPFRMSATPAAIRDRAPFLGEHNEKVLGRYPRYTAERIAELSKSGILVQEPRVAELRAKKSIH